jgi:ribosomal RNA-processing protein 1
MTSTARRNKGKGRAQQEEKVVAALPLGKQLAHTGKPSSTSQLISR